VDEPSRDRMNKELLEVWDGPAMVAAIRYNEREDWAKINVRTYVRELSMPLQQALSLSPMNADRMAKLALAEVAFENGGRVVAAACAILNSPGEFRARYLTPFVPPIAGDIASQVQGKPSLKFDGHIETVDFISLADRWASPFREKTFLDTNASRDVIKIALAMFAYFESGNVAARVSQIADSIERYTSTEKKKFTMPWIDFDLIAIRD